MCFSPEADFVAAAAIGAVGVQTLREVRRPEQLVVGALPLLFAAHQLVEGFVWLGLRGEVSSGVRDAATQVYLIYAQAVLPVLVPLGFLLLEPVRRRRRWMWPLLAVGLVVGLRLLWVLTQYPTAARVHAHGIEYVTHTPLGTVVALLYVMATCVPALVSSRPFLRWFGVANLIGLTVTAAVKSSDFISVWCVYAALVSVLVLVQFRRTRQTRPSGPMPRTA